MQNGADNIRIGHSFNGLMFSSQMSPDSVYKTDSDDYWYGGNLEHDNIPATLSKWTIMLVVIVMVWAGIMQDAHTLLHVFDSGSMNA